MRHMGMVLVGTPGSIRDAARAWIQVKVKAGHATCPGKRLRARAVSFLCISVRHFPPRGPRSVLLGLSAAWGLVSACVLT